MDLSRHTTSIIFDSDDIILINCDSDVMCVTGQRFIDRVIDDFPDEMMKSSF